MANRIRRLGGTFQLKATENGAELYITVMLPT